MLARACATTAVLALGAAAIGGALFAPTRAVAAASITITPNPAYQDEAFEGWGTSLAWFANATGGYPERLREHLYDKVFGTDGLNLNIARYNIGGGNASDVPPYLRAGAAVEGWWNPNLRVSDSAGPVTSNYADRDRYAAVWDAHNPAFYNLTADQTQQWWVNALKNKITKWEAFSNSPPYFMTNSGYVSGGTNSWTDQLKTTTVVDFVTYLKTVAQSVEKRDGISFDTIDPFNEPNTNYWGTNIDPANGWPKKGGQEGAHMSPMMQDTVTKALATELARPDTTTTARISAMDETNPSIFAEDWSQWSPEAKNDVSQLNVHSYSTTGRVVARDISKTSGTPLWMSEVEGDWDGTGVNNQTNIENGIGVSNQVIGDLRELEPSAWVLWQPVEDYYNMQKVEKLNWGSIMVDFDCNADGNSVRRIADGEADPSCKIVTNSKYNTLRNFTHYILPGDHMIPSTDVETTSAIPSSGTGLTMVHVNDDSAPQTITVDLSKFANVAAGGTLTPIVTTASPADNTTRNALVSGTPVAISPASKSVAVTVPAKSVSTLLITGVSGIATSAVPLQDGHSYQIIGTGSAKALTANHVVPAGMSPGATITTPVRPGPIVSRAALAPQLWTAEKLTKGKSNTEHYVLRNSSGKILAANATGTFLADAAREQAAKDPSQQWVVTTTDGVAYSFVNAQFALALDIPGGATAEGASVGVYQSNKGSNQSWSLHDTEGESIQSEVFDTLAKSFTGVSGTLVSHCPVASHRPPLV